MPATLAQAVKEFLQKWMDRYVDWVDKFSG
jgi:hypothetical protein